MYRSIIFISIFTIAASAQAQTPFRNLEDVWKYADEHNITIKTVKYEYEKSKYAKYQAYCTLLPQVNTTGSYTDNLSLQTTLVPSSLTGGTSGGYKTLQFGQQFVYAGGLNAQMNVLNLQNCFNAKLAMQTEAMNKDSLAGAKKTVYQALANQFYSYLLLREAMRLTEASMLSADSTFQSVKEKFNAGTANKANLDVAELNFKQLSQNFSNAGYQVKISVNNLKSLLGMAEKDTLEIDASLSQSINADVNVQTWGEDPSVNLAYWRTKLTKTQYNVANMAFLPTINIVYNYNTTRSDKTFEPFTGMEGTAAFFPSKFWALQASFPLFNSGNRVFQSKKQWLNYKESVEQFESIKKTSALADANIILNFNKTREALNLGKEMLALSTDNYSHVCNRYNEGLASLDDKLTAFRDFINAQNQYLNNMSDYLVQLYQYKIRQYKF